APVEVEDDDVDARRRRREPLGGGDRRRHALDGDVGGDGERALGALVLRAVLRERQRLRRRELCEVSEDGVDAAPGHGVPPILIAPQSDSIGPPGGQTVVSGTTERSSRSAEGADRARRSEATMRIGFIGLGNMGGPMAQNLMKAGHALVVHDTRSEMMKPHLERGAKGADSPRGAAQGAELILTSLPGPPEVEAVALGEHGIIRGAAPGAIYADLSTGSPRVMRKIHAAFRAKGMHVLDAPVSGGVW